ncbi:Acg family FMN-binding oxidoreductase [Gordonia rhizosphera]|uniref:Nitroreductase domain-containing protein n=1 Tax=Gordonia rhizosphera NBRC 16068 TaxID=1108045 RepID=K6VA39_9ACTN|nr:nitroreductase family protein [Gordonia rhizosphera]GAB93083.1 hypothetical protein GORHZ_205_00250 [Gordonia rhizosphera NBRC 16068]
MVPPTATTDGILERALATAVRAPSAHNTQPWLWRQSGDGVDLFIDPDLVLRSADPHGRDALLSLGALLNHLQIALAVEGRRAEIHLFPRTFDPQHVAHVDFSAPHTPTEDESALAAAIGRRRTDRRRYDPRPLAPDQLNDLLERASRHGVVASVVSDEAKRSSLARAARDAAAVHSEDPEYQLELATWSGLPSPDEGVPSSNVVRSDPGAEFPARAFAGSTPETSTAGGAVGDLIVIGSEVDDGAAQLRAGEAASEMLLAATSAGLATCPVTEPLEISEIRAEITDKVLDNRAYPQIILRLGRPMPDAPELPLSPRRSIEDSRVR